MLSAVAALLCGYAGRFIIGAAYGYMIRPLPLDEKTKKLSALAAWMLSTKTKILTIAIELYLWANIFVAIHGGI